MWSYRMVLGLILLPILAVWTVSAQAAGNFLAGADFSLLPFFEARKIAYRDGGQAEDGLSILRRHGINCVRLRLFTSSTAQAAADPYDYTNNLSYTLPLAQRVKNAGLLFCLDFHYSDTWADAGHQATPAAWTNLTLTQLVQQMRTYNSNTIASFAGAGAMPDYVQVGNEITSGMLWPMGKVSGNGGTQWSQLGQLMNAAIQGIHDASGTNAPKIIVHIDRGGDWATTMWFFDNLIAQGVPFDIIGQSYYPFYQGSPASLSNCLNNAAARYSKPMIVAEIAFPWTNSCPSSWTNSLFGFPPSPAGQVSFMATVAGIVESLPSRLGSGVFYWGTEYQAASGVSEAGFNTASFFDGNGNVLPVADAVGGMASPLLITASLTGSNLRLEWPLSGVASRLMISTNLGSSTMWSLAPGTIQTGTVFSTTVPLSNKNCFYRLQSN